MRRECYEFICDRCGDSRTVSTEQPELFPHPEGWIITVKDPMNAMQSEIIDLCPRCAMQYKKLLKNFYSNTEVNTCEKRC